MTKPVSLVPHDSSFCRAAYVAHLESYANNDPVSTVTDRAARALALNLTSASTARPTFKTGGPNGKSYYSYDGVNDYSQTAGASDFNFMHDGHNISVIAVVRQAAGVNPNRLDIVYDSNGTSSTNIGTSLAMDDRVSVPRNNTIAGTVTKGVTSFPIVDSNQQNVLNPPVWQIISMRLTAYRFDAAQQNSSTYDQIFAVDGIVVGGSRVANTPHSSANSTNKFTVGSISTLATFFSQIDIAGLWIFDESIPDRQWASYLRWIEDYMGISPWRLIADRGYNAFPGIARLPDKSLLVGFQKAWKHGVSNDTSIVGIKSSDRGRSWGAEREIAPRISTKDSRGSNFLITQAGTLLMTYFSHDGGTDIDAFVRRDTSCSGLGFGSPITPTVGFTLWSATAAPPVELSNGRLLLPIYGLDTSQTFESVEVISSTDDGATWGSPVRALDGQALSKRYNEAQIVKISGTYPTETLHMYVRNDTDNRIDKCISTDSGATWGAASTVKTGLSGQPTIFKASSGTYYLMCRQTTGNWRGVMYWSADSVTWSTNPFFIGATDGFWAYGSIAEVEPGVLILVSTSQAAALGVTSYSNNATLRSRIIREETIQLIT